MRRCAIFFLALAFAFSSAWSSPLPGYVQLSSEDYQKLVAICSKLKTLNETLLDSSGNSEKEILLLKREIETIKSELATLKTSLLQSQSEQQDLSRKLLEVEELLSKAQILLQSSEKSLIAQSLLLNRKILVWKVATAGVATIAVVEFVLLASGAAKALVTTR